MRSVVFLLLLALPLQAQVTRDTTVYTATRIRTASNGNIISVSVSKVAGPTHDTVVVTRVAGRDTVAYWPTQVGNRLAFSLVPWDRGRGQPAPFLVPTITVHDTTVRYDTVKVVSGGVPLDTIMQVVHVDQHIFTYRPDTVGYWVYLETGTSILGMVVPGTLGWNALQRIPSTVEGDYPHIWPLKSRGIFPTQDAAALALYSNCCPTKP
jgi:hypothetical protein